MQPTPYTSSKEQCLYLHRIQTLEEARQMIAAFIYGVTIRLIRIDTEGRNTSRSATFSSPPPRPVPRSRRRPRPRVAPER